MNDRLERLRLIRTEGVGPLTYRRLMARFGGAAAAIAALPELARAGGRQTPPQLYSAREAEREMALLDRQGARLLFLEDPEYPPFLAELTDPPPAIAVLGDARLLSQRSVAIVGARNATIGGRQIAERLAADLAEKQLAIVSGLARGIDAAAHAGAMRTGRTVAVLAGGIDVPYPPEHAKLHAEIAANGAVLAEAPPGTRPLARHFPKRNRVIAGLSLGVVVVEAALRSGTMLTARLANEAGRELFAVPGSPLDPRSQGANDLIRQGANLTETAADVLGNLPDHPGREGLARDPLFLHKRSGFAEPRAEAAFADERAELAKARRQVPELVGAAPTKVDEIARHCQLSVSVITAALIELELAGRVEILPGNRVVICGNP